VWTIVSAALLVIVGVTAHIRVGNALQTLLQEDLRATLNTKLSWIDLWHNDQIAAARSAAEESFTFVALTSLHDLAESMTEDLGDGDRLLESPAAMEFRHQLMPVLKAGRYSGYLLTDETGCVLACSQARHVGKVAFAQHPQQFIQRVLAGTSVVTRPYPSLGPLPTADGSEKKGQPTMFTCAPVADETGQILGALCLRIDPLQEFTRTLNVGRFGESGEVIAFDAQGLFLTPCRYEQEMKAKSLLQDRSDATSLLTSHVHLPVDASDNTLSRFEGAEGCSTTGFLNYRGENVVGAWGWLPDQGMGIVVQLDSDEALRPLRRLTFSGWILLSLLSISTLLLIVNSVRSEKMRQGFVNVAEQLEEFGQYTLGEKIGEGAMGAVYRAQHALLRRPTAIKILRASQENSLEVDRFTREVQLTSELSHPNIVTVYDYGRNDDGQFFLVLEYLDGMTLQRLVDTYGPLPDGRVIRIVEQICAALTCAHERGLLHRDIKPENVMLQNTPGAPDLVKVLDFGLAKQISGLNNEASLTHQNTIVGTPLYMAPERFGSNDCAEIRSDLYAVGAVGYFLLTGRNVFEIRSLPEAVFKHSTELPISPSGFYDRPICKTLEVILLECLSKDANNRPADADSLRDRLLKCLPSEPWADSDARHWWTERPHRIFAEKQSTAMAATVIADAHV